MLDTSVAVKWFVEDEPDRERARALRDAFVHGHVQLSAPPLLLAELANALRYRADFDAARVGEAVESCAALGIAMPPVGVDLLNAAVRLSYLHDVSVYDATFVALAQADDADYVTADERFARRLRTHPRVKSLRTYRIES